MVSQIYQVNVISIFCEETIYPTPRDQLGDSSLVFQNQIGDDPFN